MGGAEIPQLNEVTVCFFPKALSLKSGIIVNAVALFCYLPVFSLGHEINFVCILLSFIKTIVM